MREHLLLRSIGHLLRDRLIPLCLSKGVRSLATPTQKFLPSYGLKNKCSICLDGTFLSLIVVLSDGDNRLSQLAKVTGLFAWLFCRNVCISPFSQSVSWKLSST